jgi:hypothetical protein
MNAIEADPQRTEGGSLLPNVASKLAPTSINFPVGGSLLPNVASKLAPTSIDFPVGGSLLPTT